jgi:hypothetical protein
MQTENVKLVLPATPSGLVVYTECQFDESLKNPVATRLAIQRSIGDKCGSAPLPAINVS